MPIRIQVGTKAAMTSLCARTLAHKILQVNRDEDREANIGTATGGTFEDPYREFIGLVTAGTLSMQRTRCFGLDEYNNLPKNHPQSYHTFMVERLWGPGSVPTQWRHLPDPEDPVAYEEMIKGASGGGIDLQLLGIGSAAHIGFNEVGSSHDSVTRVVTLAETTLRDNSRYFGGDLNATPSEAVTMGIRTILGAKELLLVAFGSAKAPAIRAALEGPITEACPASAIQRHANVTVLLDGDAASLLTAKSLGEK